jgi:HD-like signal output (HDOD) protein
LKNPLFKALNMHVTDRPIQRLQVGAHPLSRPTTENNSPREIMTAAISVGDAERQLGDSSIQAMIKDIPIPPRPVVVQQLQTEMGSHEPDLRKAAHIVSLDVGLTVAVLKTINSPLYGLSRKVESVEQAVSMIGLRQLSILVTALAMRSLLKGDAKALGRFFDTSAKRAYAMSRMAKATKVVDVGLAQTYGLFCDVGIPLLLNRFPGYLTTLQNANMDAERSFTAVEQAAHDTDHALIGAMMVKSWGLPASVALAIRLHHDYAVFLDPKIPREISALIAMGLVAEVAIQRFARLHSTVEWFKGGDYVAGALVLSTDEVEEWIEQLIEDFAAGID